MDEMGFPVADALSWFPRDREDPYVLVKVDEDYANGWAESIHHAIRRCYLTDDLLQDRSQQLEQELGGSTEERERVIIGSKLPDPGSVMSGDFGEILVYIYHAVRSHPQVAFGPKKWRLKEARTKAAPYSDVLHFILPSWPTPTAQDVIICSEVKSKATDNDNWSPIEEAIKGCSKDRTNRLAKTLVWLRDRAMGENLGTTDIAHLDRFINAIDYPQAAKRFYAVAVICSSLIDDELNKAALVTNADYTLVVISVPNLHATYTAVFKAVRESSLERQAP